MSFASHFPPLRARILSSDTHKQMEAPTNLVHLSIGAISDHFHQFENPGWVLDYRAQNKPLIKGIFIDPH